MEHLQNLFSRYERILIFDTETTGLNFQKDEIIQFSAVLLEQQNGEIAVTQQYDRLIQLASGQTVPPEIQRLTGHHHRDGDDPGHPPGSRPPPKSGR